MNDLKNKVIAKAQQELQGYKISSFSFGNFILPGSNDEQLALSLTVPELIKDLPNDIEVDGVKYPIHQSQRKITLLSTENELDIKTTKPAGERLEKWSKKGQRQSDGRVLRAVVFENDCAAANPADNKKKIRPLKAGAAITTDQSSIGTLGCFAIDNEDGTLVGVTNAHVLLGQIPLLTSENNPQGYLLNGYDTKVYQGDFTSDAGVHHNDFSNISEDDVIGKIKRYFPVGLEYEYDAAHYGYKNHVKSDQFQLDAALIAMKKGTMDGDSWKLVGIDNTEFNNLSSPPTFAEYPEFLTWLHDSYWAGYSQDVGGGEDEFETPQDPLMLTSGAGSGPQDGTVAGADNYRWRVSAPLRFQELEIQNGDNGQSITKFGRENVAIVRQQNKDRYRPFSDDDEATKTAVARGDWWCADSVIPGDSGSVLYSKINDVWKAVGLIYAADSNTSGQTTIYHDGIMIPFYLVAKLLNISPWDGSVSDDLFLTDSDIGFRVDARHVKGPSDLYKQRVAGKSYFQVGTVPRASRPYPPTREEAFAKGGYVKPVAQGSYVDQFVKYSSIGVDTPEEGSFDQSNQAYQSNPVWFNIKGLNIQDSDIPAAIKDPGLGVVSLDLAIVDVDKAATIEDFYFAKDRGTSLYGSSPIMEIWGSQSQGSAAGGVVHLSKKLKELLGGGKKVDYANGTKFLDLSRTRKSKGVSGPPLKVNDNIIDVKNVNCFTSLFPWKRGTSPALKGPAKADPADLESWCDRGAKIFLVLSYVGKDIEYVIESKEVGQIEKSELGTFPVVAVDPVDDNQNEKVLEFTIDPSMYQTMYFAIDKPDSANYQNPFGYDSGTYYKSVHQERTIALPIWAVGSGGATIDWGDSTTTTIDANFEIKRGDHLWNVWKTVCVGGTVNPEGDEVHTKTDKLVHKYSSDGPFTIKITGGVLKFGCYANWLDQTYVNKQGTTMTAAEMNWNSSTRGGPKYDDTFRYSLMFSSRVVSIEDFPNWENCEFTMSFIMSNITHWNKTSIFKNFKSVGGFVSHIKNYDDQWVSAGFDADFAGGENGPFDNWIWPQNYDEQIGNPWKKRVWQNGYVYNKHWDSVYYFHRGPNRMADTTYDAQGHDFYWDHNDRLVKIKFNSNLTLNGSQIADEQFYGHMLRQAKDSGFKTNVKSLVLKAPYSSGEFSSVTTDFTWINHSDVNLVGGGEFDFSCGSVFGYSQLKTLAMLKNGTTIVSTKGLDNLNQMFKGQTLNQGDIEFLGNLLKFNDGASMVSAFEGATIKSPIKLDSWAMNGSDLSNMFKNATWESGGLALPAINDPASIESMFEGAVLKAPVTGLGNLKCSEATKVKKAFYQAEFTSNLSNIGVWNINEGEIFDMITEVAINIEAEETQLRPDVFETLSGDITLPDNLKFLDSIKGYYRILARNNESNITQTTVSNEKSYYGDGALQESNNVVPDLSEVGLYAFLVDAGYSLHYDVKGNSAEKPWRSTYTAPYELGLYESDSGWQPDDDNSKLTEVTNKELLQMYKMKEPGIVYDNALQKNVINSSSSTIVDPLYDDVGRNSYWAIVTVDKTKYNKPHAYIRFKPRTFVTETTENVSLVQPDWVMKALHRPLWNGGSEGQIKSLLSQLT